MNHNVEQNMFPNKRERNKKLNEIGFTLASVIRFQLAPSGI